jgi:hypothetical protein
MDITISISNTEYTALEYVAASPEDWADNAITNRARIAIDEIVTLYTTRALDEGVSIPSTREDIVADAYSRGWIQTAADRGADIIEQT